MAHVMTTAKVTSWTTAVKTTRATTPVAFLHRSVADASRRRVSRTVDTSSVHAASKSIAARTM